jgi:hypothetical protein
MSSTPIDPGLPRQSEPRTLRKFVGIDLHLHRSVIARLDEQGNELGWVRIENDPKVLVREVRRAGRRVPVAIEATYGWYWATTRCWRRASRCIWRIRMG